MQEVSALRRDICPALRHEAMTRAQYNIYPGMDIAKPIVGFSP